MELKDIGALISQIGFPSFVAIFVLVRLERAIKDLTSAVNRIDVHLRDQQPGWSYGAIPANRPKE